MQLRDPINIKQVAQMCGVTPAMVSFWVNNEHPNGPQAMRIAGRWVFEREEVQQFAEAYRAAREARAAKPGNTRRRAFYERHGK